MPDTGQIHEHLVSFPLTLQHAVDPSVHVNPSKGSLNSPALPAVLLLPPLARRKVGFVLVTGREDRDNPPFPAGPPEGVTVIPFICADPSRPMTTAVDADPINRF